MSDRGKIAKINEWINFYNEKIDKMKKVTIATKVNRVFYENLIKRGRSSKDIVEMIQPNRRKQFTKDITELIVPPNIKKNAPFWKKFFIKMIIIILLLMGSNAYAGDSTNTDPNPRYGGNGDGYGLMALGGVTLAVGGFVTRPDRYYNGTAWVDKPFYNQGPRASAIVCGVSLTVTGLISAILK